MTEMYNWLTVWDRSVNSKKRPDPPKDTPCDRPRRKVKVKK